MNQIKNTDDLIGRVITATYFDYDQIVLVLDNTDFFVVEKAHGYYGECSLEIKQDFNVMENRSVAMKLGIVDADKLRQRIALDEQQRAEAVVDAERREYIRLQKKFQNT